MPQETNLNVAPYFDDFDQESNYNKVLFKPAYPIQARELNNLQSILQNQIEDMGDNLFKEGSVIIPGQLTYNDRFYCIQIQAEYLGIPVSLYLDQLIGKRITGRTSGVTATVVTYITNQQSVRGLYTLYLNYEDSGDDNSTDTFQDDEVLVTNTTISYATTFIAAGEGFANTISTNAAAIGSAFTLNQGVYFLRGYFVNVDSQILILDQYSTNSNYRIGLTVNEEVVSSDVDPTLNDNAQGYNNYTAPGADRLKITATLSKKLPDNYADQGFVQLAEVTDGSLSAILTTTQYNTLGDELAKRTFDESGHYYVKEFVTTVRESLDNQEGNRGVYLPGQITAQGQVPTDDLMVYKLAPGKAYVRGYLVEKRTSSLIDVPKPRTSRLVKNQGINFGFGPTLGANRVYGSPIIGFNTTNSLSLRSQRVGIDSITAPGKEIGQARLYDFALESGSYNNTNSNINQWDLSLFDIDTYQDLNINIEAILTTPLHIEGESSGATGFLKYDVSSGTALTAYSVRGDFFQGERLKFNGLLDNSRFLIDAKNYKISDVKSVYSVVGTSNTFTADIIQSPTFSFEVAQITAGSLGVSTITSPALGGRSFTGIATVNNLVRYSRPGFNDFSLARITEVKSSSLTVTSVESVNGVYDGSLPSADFTSSDLKIVSSKLQNSNGSGNQSNSEALYSILPRQNIESVDLSDSDIIFRQSFTAVIDAVGSSAAINVPDANTDVFLPFDDERYSLITSDGKTEVLTSDKFNFAAGSTILTIDGLSGPDPSATLIATIRKKGVSSKTKLKNISNRIIIDKSTLPGSGIGGTTLNDGLTYGNFPFGTRVQDPIISLNVPDVVAVYGVYESTDLNDPESPFMTLASMNGPSASTDDLIIGETLTGSISGAKAIYLTRKTDNTIGFVYQNENVFENNEPISFSDSAVRATANQINIGSVNVTGDYLFYNGQKESFYDYGRIIRRGTLSNPTKKLIVYFTNGYYDSIDTGDITTVNSYNDFDYATEIGAINGVRITDIIDARPRVSNYTVADGIASPLEYAGRKFDDGNHSSSRIIASDESVTLDYKYYLARADRIYLNKEGNVNVKYGSPDDIPSLPEEESGSLNIANIYMPAYLYNVEDARVRTIEHKRYQMNDISKLEQRIKNLEYYTSLNLLEQSTLNTFVSDINGFNRFKSGIFVDNFTTTQPQDTTIGIRNSIDTKRKVLRPSHYSTAFNLQLNAVDTAADSRFEGLNGSGIRRSGSMITLDYTNVPWLTQPFSTRVENVTPFLITYYQGSVALEPTVDVWIDTNRQEMRNVSMEGSFRGVSEALGAEITDAADGSRIGVTPVLWDSWETTGVTLDASSSGQRTESLTAARQRLGNGAIAAPGWANGALSEVQSTTVDGAISLAQNRTGIQQTINEVINTESLGDRIVNRDILHFMRSRNIQVTGTKLKPFTTLYSFFDGVDVTRFTVPKLIQIQMNTGTFVVGETVTGVMPSSEQSIRTSSSGAEISFRVANTNHKYGPFNIPTDFYTSNPYSRSNVIPNGYTQSSSLLNVDTFSLQSEDFPQFSGYIQQGMILRGENGAEATVTSVRLLTDNVGTLIASFFVPDSSNISNPLFETGRNVFRFSSSPVNSTIRGTTTTSAEEIFYSQGDIDNTQEVTLSLRNATVTTNDDFRDTRQLTDDFQFELVTGSTFRPTPPPPPPPAPPAPAAPPAAPPWRGRDPLAQTFRVSDTTGIFITKVDIFFRTKAESLPVTLQIRETLIGTPTSTVLPYSEVDITPDKIFLSDDASTPTTFTFEAPVFLEGRKEYAIVLLSNSTEYNVYISRLGETDITTLGTEAGQILVTSQPILGSLFKSQNASVWTPSQYEDLKFSIYRSDFVGVGNVEFFNPQLPTALERISRNGVTAVPRNLSIGIGTTVADNDMKIGNTIIQVDSDGTGELVGFAGSITGNLTLTNVGTGYTPGNGQFSYSGIALTSVTGRGTNATADITISNGVAIAATVVSGGKGYQVGDVLTPLIVGTEDLGASMQLSVPALQGFNELIVDKVQGTFGPNNRLQYTDTSGIATDINAGIGGSVFPIGPYRVNSDGLHLKIFQRNHGMYSEINRVTLKNIETDIPATPLILDYQKTETGTISVGNTANFSIFEGVGVAITNPGYIKIGSEIIEYTGVSDTNTLTGITSRGVDNTLSSIHRVNDLVTKYEFSGISLRRINKTHILSDATVQDAIGIDHYHIKIDMSKDGTNKSDSSNTFGARYLTEIKLGGGINARGSYNLPYSLIVPNINNTSPTGTTVFGAVRSVSETSVSGSEVSYIDQGYQEIALKEKNYFETQRMVVSKTNEQTYLSTLPGNKSFSMSLNMNSFDKRISPTIDLDQSSVIFISNRVNSPITNYATDSRINRVPNDPNSLMYVTKLITLENPASSLRVYIDGYVSNYNDIRMLYALNQETTAQDTIFTAFPGYGNIDDFGNVINPTVSNGTSDIEVRKSDSYTQEPSINLFKEYTFTIDKLQPFKNFRIKLIGTSTNQSVVPQFRNLRVIALA
tara:strand:+ start:21511 stop:29064 length:7554 start_codon:yes stop_codon:yes gene_type:complete